MSYMPSQASAPGCCPGPPSPIPDTVKELLRDIRRQRWLHAPTEAQTSFSVAAARSYFERYVTALGSRTRARARKEIRACHARDFPGRRQLNQTVPVLSNMVKEISKCREPAVSDTMACLLGQGIFDENNRLHGDFLAPSEKKPKSVERTE